MTFAFLEDGMIEVHANAADATIEFRAKDIESRAVVFYDEDGTYLSPELATPPRRLWFGLVTVEGEYGLVRCAPSPPEIDPIDVALSEASGVKPNNFHFISVDEIRAHVARCRESAAPAPRPDP
jgi:hypothetical protein